MGNEKQRRGGVDFKAAQQLLAQKKKERSDRGGGSGGSEVRWAGLPDTGEMKVRFLPPYGDERVPGMVVHKHYNLPEHEGLKRGGNITCFRTWELECPICKVLDEYKDQLGEDALKDFTGSAAYFNVLILENNEYNPKTPYLLKTSEYNYMWLLEQFCNMDIGDITDVEDGAHVIFKRKAKKGAFERSISRRSSAIGDSPEDIDVILDDMYDMKKIWREPDDNYYNIADDLAADLRDILEDRLLQKPRGEGKDKGNKEVRGAKDDREKERSGGSQDRSSRSERPAGRSSGGSGSSEGSRRRPAPAPEEQTPAPEDENLDNAGEQTPPEEPPAPPARSRRKPQEEGEQTPPPAPPARSRRSPREENKDAGEPEDKGNRKPAAGGDRPAKAPECFGVDHSDERRCQICAFEYDCETASTK
jgi:uncharacterized membrane protein YgcG